MNIRAQIILFVGIFVIWHTPVHSLKRKEYWFSELLDASNQTAQIEDASKWIATNVKPGKTSSNTWVSNCHSDLTTFYFGASGVLEPKTQFTRIYDSLPSHNSIFLTMFVGLVDDWRIGDKISLLISSRSLSPPVTFSPLIEINNQRATWASDYCGSALTDLQISVFIQASHSEPELRLDLITEKGSDTSAYFIISRLAIQLTQRIIDNNWAWLDPSTEIIPYSSALTTANSLLQGTCDPTCRGNVCVDLTDQGCFTCAISHGNNGAGCVPCDPSYNFCVTTCGNGLHPYGTNCDPDRSTHCSNWAGDICTTCEEGYYLFSNGCSKCAPYCKSCSSTPNNCITCHSGYELVNNNCTGNIEVLQTISKVQILATQVTNLAATAINLVNFDNPGAMMMSLLAKMFEFLKFLRINYPSKLQYLLEQSQPPLILIEGVTSIPQSLEEKITKYKLPENFEKYSDDVHSSFLVNFWSYLVVILGLGFVIFIILILDWIMMKYKQVYSFFTKLKTAIKWNYFLATFLGYYGDVTFYTSMELRTIRLKSLLELLSFLTCIIMNLIIFAVFVRAILVLISLAKLRKNGSMNLSREYLQGYQILFENSKETSVLQQSFFIIFTLKRYFYSTVIAYLFDYPLVQTIMICILSLTMLLYLMLIRPFKDSFDLVVFVAQEVVLQIENICVFFLALDDVSNIQISSNGRIVIGEMIIGCNCAIIGLGLLYQLVQMLLIVRNIIKYIINKCKNKKERIPKDPQVKEGKSTSSLTPINSIFDSKFTNNDRTMGDISDDSIIKEKSKEHSLDRSDFPFKGRLKSRIAYATIRHQTQSNKNSSSLELSGCMPVENMKLKIDTKYWINKD